MAAARQQGPAGQGTTGTSQQQFEQDPPTGSEMLAVGRRARLRPQPARAAQEALAVALVARWHWAGAAAGSLGEQPGIWLWAGRGFSFCSTRTKPGTSLQVY